MSRIGKAPIAIPPQVAVMIEGKAVKAKGPLGELSQSLHPALRAELKDGRLTLIAPEGAPREVRAVHGTLRARLANMIEGVRAGFTKTLEIVGLGYKAQIQGADKIVLNLGKSHPVEFAIPKGVKASLDPKGILLTLSGPDKDLVGSTAAAIRAIRPPEPYKGTGIKYQGEHLIRKAGKTAAGASAAAGGKK